MTSESSERVTVSPHVAHGPLRSRVWALDGLSSTRTDHMIKDIRSRTYHQEYAVSENKP